MNTPLIKGTHVRHATDPHDRSHGIVSKPPDHRGLVEVTWFGAHEPDDWIEKVHESELRHWKDPL
jgi:hypothetical protein